ncbi:MAG: metallophosphoesterase [Candidatus Eremiobacterota bacterium]
MAADLTVYHTNDMHGREFCLDHLEGAPLGPEALLVDVGDAIRGSNTMFRRREPILQRMARLGYAAMAMGNREFHYTRAVQRWRQADRGFPILAANLEDRRTRSCLWQDSLVVERAGVRVGLVGATPVQYPIGAVWERLSGFRFLAPEQCLPPLMEDLRPRCDVLLFLSHLGYDRDRDLRDRLGPVDLIVGGHTHTVLDAPDRDGRVPIVQTGSHGRFLGRLDLWLGDPMRLEYSLIPTARAA